MPDTTTPDPAGDVPTVTADQLREAAATLRTVAEAAAEDTDYARTLNLGTGPGHRERITGGALTLEAVADNLDERGAP